MDTETNFNVAGGGGALPTKRSSASATKALSVPASNPLRTLQDRLDALPDARPGAVERARELIADPGFPSEEQEQAIAYQLATHILAENEARP